jgi:hypothetical protein
MYFFHVSVKAISSAPSSYTTSALDHRRALPARKPGDNCTQRLTTR